MDLYRAIPVPKCPACKSEMPFNVPNGRDNFAGEPVSRCKCGASVRLHLCGCIALDGKTHKCRAKLAPHFAAIVAAARAKGWPESFETDVSKCDRAHLAGVDPSHPFAWGLREGGSHIIPAGPYAAEPAQYGRGLDYDGQLAVQCQADAFGETVWYFWDGIALIPCSLAEVKRRLQISYRLRATYECSWLEENGLRDVISRCTGSEWLRENRESFNVDDLPARVGDELRFGGGGAPRGALRRVA